MSELYSGMKDYTVPAPSGTNDQRDSAVAPVLTGNVSTFARVSPDTSLLNGIVQRNPSAHSGIMLPAELNPATFAPLEVRTTTEADLLVRNPFFRDRELGINPFYTSTEAAIPSQSTTIRLSVPDPFSQKVPDDNTITNGETSKTTAVRTADGEALSSATNATRTRNGRRGDRKRNNVSRRMGVNDARLN